MNILNTFLFVILPYLALVIFLIGTIYRYRHVKFQISSLSSGFLEGKKLFWGSVPFHWGIVFLFFGHLIAFLIPQSVLIWNSHPVRLLVLEVAAFAFGLSMLVGLANLIYRRSTNDRIRVVSTWVDYVVEGLLVVGNIGALGSIGIPMGIFLVCLIADPLSLVYFFVGAQD